MVREINFELSWRNQDKVDKFIKRHPKHIGIDEVGRGALAGPILVAGIGLKSVFTHFLLTDSKLLSKRERYEAQSIIKTKLAYEKYMEVSPNEINERKLNINVLIKDAIMKILDDAFEAGITGALIDWIEINHDKIETLSLSKMEIMSSATASASIMAKIKRDQLMIKYEKIYPGYGFVKNSGYGSPAHIKAIKTQGLTDIHRKFYCQKALASSQNSKKGK